VFRVQIGLNEADSHNVRTVPCIKWISKQDRYCTVYADSTSIIRYRANQLSISSDSVNDTLMQAIIGQRTHSQSGTQFLVWRLKV